MDLSQLLNIDSGNKVLSFLAKRITKNDYRGIQLSQHNRYTYEQVIRMLEIMYELINDQKMQIRTTDLNKRPYNIDGEELYAEYTRLVKGEFGKSTQDSIRKNLFVDFHRMGLIDRYTKDGEKIEPYKQNVVKYVSLTKLGQEIIRADIDVFKQYMLFTQALDNLLSGFATDLLEIVQELEYISIHEMQYFVSYLYHEIDNKIISKDDVILLVKEYRSMAVSQKKELDERLKNICNPSLFDGDKTTHRDYHNWINEAQQIFSILKMTVYYEINNDNSRLNLRLSNDSLFQSNSKLKRSVTKKEEYFAHHNIEKRSGFELHHIIPLSWANSREEFFILDDWINMIYIDAFSHAKITQNRNRNVKMSIVNSNFDIAFTDFNDNSIRCYYDKNAIFKKEIIKAVQLNNEKLLQGMTISGL